MSEAEVPDGFRPVADAADLAEGEPTRVSVDGQPVALVRHEGDAFAVDDRCPHMGFPLSEGSVDEGVLTCHWHHARFELSGGDTFDPWANDVLAYPVVEADGTVYVDPNPDPDRSSPARWRARLDTGLEENLRLVVAKAVVGLDDAGVAPTETVAQGVDFGTRYRADGWSSGLTILGCLAGVLPDLRPADRRRALYTGLRHVASDCAGEPPRFDQPALDVRDPDPERLTAWVRENVEVRDRDGAERALRAVVARCSRDRVERTLFAAATDHVYLDGGHALDFCNTAIETLDYVGWDDRERVADTLASLVPVLVDADRGEEQSAWRQPVDLAGLLFDAYDDLGLEDRTVAGTEWTAPDGFDETLLGDDPRAIVAALRAAVAAGATPVALADRVCHAAASRVARFGTANEFGDWNTVHHTFTYANAVRRAADRVADPRLYRGVFDAALSVYLDRFLNIPPAPVPEAGASDDDCDPEMLREELLQTFDTEGRVNDAARLVGAHLDAGADAAALWRTLGRGLLREDAGFHAIQAYEAGRRQFEAATTDGERRVALVAAARYLAAQFPTRREAEQTFGIAERLSRGEAVHEEPGK
ncbi:MAG: Rieske 2Fe-2S domain-containing protein [Haloferacaceae archaeon]